MTPELLEAHGLLGQTVRSLGDACLGTLRRWAAAEVLEGDAHRETLQRRKESATRLLSYIGETP